VFERFLVSRRERGNDARNARQIIRDANFCPSARCPENLQYPGKGIVAQLENQKSARFEEPGSLANERGVDGEAIFAGE